MKKVTEMIAEAGGGSSLPAVTADDNGDVLTVVSGEWAKASIPNGVCIYESEALNKTYNDIDNMVKSGVIPYYIWYNNDDDEPEYLVYVLSSYGYLNESWSTFFYNILNADTRSFINASKDGYLYED